MITQQISVFLENKTGSLAAITGLFAEHGVDLRAINIAETTDYGVVRLIADDEKAALALLKENGYIASSSPVVLAPVPDRPGGLHELLLTVARENIPVDYMYSVFGGREHMALMILRTEDPEKLERSISHAGTES